MVIDPKKFEKLTKICHLLTAYLHLCYGTHELNWKRHTWNRAVFSVPSCLEINIRCGGSGRKNERDLLIWYSNLVGFWHSNPKIQDWWETKHGTMVSFINVWPKLISIFWYTIPPLQIIWLQNIQNFITFLCSNSLSLHWHCTDCNYWELVIEIRLQIYFRVCLFMLFYQEQERLCFNLHQSYT